MKCNYIAYQGSKSLYRSSRTLAFLVKTLKLAASRTILRHQSSFLLMKLANLVVVLYLYGMSLLFRKSSSFAFS